MVYFDTITDRTFNELCPKKVAQASARQWSPVPVARRAAGFLAHKPGTRVLDIGSGPGKFCLIGAAVTDGFFTGVEQRRGLHECALKLATQCPGLNVNFVHDNITNIDFR